MNCEPRYYGSVAVTGDNTPEEFGNSADSEGNSVDDLAPEGTFGNEQYGALSILIPS